MLNLEEGKKATRFARENVELFVKHKKISSKPHDNFFQEQRGVFVTLHKYPSYDLRGCIGIPNPVMSLQDAIISSAKSVTHDPRFLPLGEEELEKVLVEITILTPPELIAVKDPKEYLSNIKIGQDGLIAENGYYKGLLLPQVPIEQNWDVEEFLSNTCMKAGLPPDAWFDKSTKIYKFRGQIFSEDKPNGDIREKSLDGSDS